MAEFGTPTVQQKTPEPGRIKSVTIEYYPDYAATEPVVG